ARDVETVLELLPNVGAQAVAAAKPQPVRALVRMRWAAHEIAAELADVLEQGAVEAHNVIPESAGGKFIPDRNPAAIAQHRAGSHDAADAVVHRQAIVEPDV